jgi:hypothetical protein
MARSPGLSTASPLFFFFGGATRSRCGAQMAIGRSAFRWRDRR